MDFARLEKNIIDVITEEQLKLGYRSEIIRLFYPLKSLNRLLGTDSTIEKMQENLQQFVELAKDRLGELRFSNTGDRFGIIIPPQGADYVHSNMKDAGFIAEFVELISRHGIKMEDVFALFHKYSDRVCIERMENNDFDYLVYFEDGTPDDYRYCLTDEGCHIIYHRFTPEDYIDFL